MATAEQALGWGIFGCGRVVERRVAPAFARVENARLAAFGSRDAARARAYAEQFNAPRGHAGLDALLTDPDVHAVYIATPNALHAGQTIACLNAGRHVLVDKPMALAVDDARRMQAAYNNNRLKLGVLHQQRLHPANRDLIRLARSGSLGTLHLVRVEINMRHDPGDAWRGDPTLAGGGALCDLGPHALDLMLAIAGNITSVDARTSTAALSLHVEDLCTARLAFDSRALGLLTVAYCVDDYGGRILVGGSEGTAVVTGAMQAAPTCRMAVKPIGGDWQDHTPAEPADCFADAIRGFSAAVLHDHDPPADADAGVAVTRLIAAIYESARRERPVNIKNL